MYISIWLAFFFVKILIFPSGCNFSLPNFIPGICKLQFVFMRCFPIIFLSIYRIFLSQVSGIFIEFIYLKSVEFSSSAVTIEAIFDYSAFFPARYFVESAFLHVKFFFTQLLENLDQTAQ